LNALSTLFISTTSLYSSLSTQLKATTIQMSSFSTQYAQQLSTQTVQFNSTIQSYPAQLTASINSTNTAAYIFATSSATTTLSNIQTSTTSAYNAFTAGLNAQAQTAALSSLYTAQALTLTGTTFNAPLDMVNYRNFTVNIYGLCNGSSNYGITYLSNNIQSLNYRKGIITIDISTVGTFYSTNSGVLLFDIYRWGLPTSVFGNVYPTIANSDYMLQYEYTILNQIIYTNLLNVYPRLRIRNPQISSIVRNVYVGSVGAYSSNIFWRGSPFQVSWSNYSFFPYGQLGAPPFNPTVNIDIVVGGAVVGKFGPYQLSQSTVTVRAPYLQNQTSPLIQTTVMAYIAGNYINAVSTVFTTAIPAFNQIQLFSPNYPNSQQTGGGFAGGTELVALTEGGKYPLYNAYANINAAGTFRSFNDDPAYVVTNLLGGALNAVGFAGQTPSTLVAGPSNVAGRFTEVSAGSPGFYVNLGSYFTNMNALQAFGASFTFTFSNALAGAYSFSAPIISSVGGSPSLYLLSNLSMTRLNCTFTSGSCGISYSYTAVSAISTTTGYTPSIFVGPVSDGNPDSAVFLDLPTFPLAPNDSISTLTFYNVPNTAPISQFSTANSQLTALVNFGGTSYRSTFLTTASGEAQVFRF